MIIDGVRAAAVSGRVFDVENPATGEIIAKVADGGPADALRAIEVAGARQADWARTAPRERGEILRRAYELVIARADELAALITAEMGKPLGQAHDEVRYGAEFLRWFSEEAVRIGGDHLVTGTSRIVVTRGPVGPCVLVTPWNFPLAMGTRKIGPAVAAGCTMVFKPAEEAPLTSLALAGILAEAGLPDGVLNVVTTSDPASVVEPWLRSGITRKLSFTGSTEIGRLLLAQAAPNVLRCSMELGGNAPFIVCEDADLPRAVDGAMIAKMRNMGEACTAANRFLVHHSLAADFTAQLAERMSSAETGPLISASAVDKVETLVRDALSRGASLVTGGSRPPGPGHFYPPTVLSDVPSDAALTSTEIFGPVAAITTFSSESDLVRLANDTSWGLVAYLYTQDIDRATRLADLLEVGMVGLNTGLVSNPAAPFGGVKHSGLGREGGRVGIEEFLELKYLAIPNR